jgi:hypothetical protein
MTTYYHGTSDRHDISEGDAMDPRLGAFEPCVWVTSSLEHARAFAIASAALGGSPVVWEVEIADWSVTAEVEDLSDPEAELEAMAEADVDVVYVECGEDGHPEAAILTKGAARFARMI